MPRKLILILLLIFTLIPTAALVAQESSSTEATCTDAQWEDAFTELSGLLNSEEEAALDPLLRLLRLEIFIRSIRTGCEGYTFTSADYPSGIIGPVSFRGSIYEGTLSVEEASGYHYMSFTVLEGDCDFVPTLSVMTSQTSDSSLFRFNECLTMIEVDSRESWTLNFTRIH